MRLLILCLALLAGPAAAQTPAPPTCWAATGAPGYVMGTTPAGTWATWWCPDGWGDWRSVRLVMRAGFAMSHPSTPASATTADVAAAYWRENVKFDCVRPRSNDPAMLGLCDAAHNAGLDTRPLPPYVVRANGTHATRPTYPLVNGVRGTFSNGTVPIRDAYGRPTACNPAQRLGDYMQVKRTPATVALCGPT